MEFIEGVSIIILGSSNRSTGVSNVYDDTKYSVPHS